MLRRLLVAILILSGFSGCREVELTTTNLIGDWVIPEASRQQLPVQFQSALAKIILSSKGDFSASELPGDLLYVRSRSHLRLITGKGRWKLDLSEGEPRLQLEFLSIDGANNGEVPFTTQLYILNRWHTPVLYYYHGDPDAGHKIEFEKK